MDSYSFISENGQVRQIIDLVAQAKNEEQDERLDQIEQIDLLDRYSLSEVKTNKRWIDGKAIYRRVYERTYTATTANIPFTDVAQQIDKIVYYDFIGPYKQYYTNENDYLRIWDDDLNKTFRILMGSQYPERPALIRIVFEYTKTTG